MSHFDITRWTDFARGALPFEEKVTLQAHLDSGCDACRLTADLLMRATQASFREEAFEIPPAVIKAAIGIFPAVSKPSFLNLPSLAARLVFNSFTDPVPAGARSSSASRHQLLYESGDYVVHLQVSEQATPVSLAGQILNLNSDTPLKGVPVFLLQGGRVIDRTMANDLGEFCLDYSPRSNLRLRVPIAAANAQINISLDLLRGPNA